MSFQHLDQTTRAQLAQTLSENRWVVACLCAEWCGSCREYKIAFEALASAHPELDFVWVDIEDQADIVGDIDVDNFPTLLIQRGEIVTFFGTMLPEIRLAERLLQVQLEKTPDQLTKEATSSADKQLWQTDCNLYHLL
jgi:thioredoxin 1